MKKLTLITLSLLLSASFSLPDQEAGDAVRTLLNEVKGNPKKVLSVKETTLVQKNSTSPSYKEILTLNELHYRLNTFLSEHARNNRSLENLSNILEEKKYFESFKYADEDSVKIFAQHALKKVEKTIEEKLKLVLDNVIREKTTSLNKQESSLVAENASSKSSQEIKGLLLLNTLNSELQKMPPALIISSYEDKIKYLEYMQDHYHFESVKGLIKEITRKLHDVRFKGGLPYGYVSKNVTTPPKTK